MKRTISRITFVFGILSLLACTPKPHITFEEEDPPLVIDKTVNNIKNDILPGSSGTGYVFLLVNGVADVQRIEMTYSFTNTLQFIPNISLSSIIDEIATSGMYVIPKEANAFVSLSYINAFVSLSYIKEDGDNIFINYITGEMWVGTSDDPSLAFSTNQIVRENEKNFDRWSIDDSEILFLNTSLKDIGKEPLHTGDVITVDFIILFQIPGTTGIYTQYFSSKTYTLQ